VSALRGIVAGTIGLSLLELLVSDSGANKNAGALIKLATGAFRRITDISVPLIPDLRTSAPYTTTD